MKKAYLLQTQPFKVPADHNKVILEHFGLATMAPDPLSLAFMVAPPGWSEPFQTPEFDEYTLVISGRKQIVIEGETLVLEAGQSIRVARGHRVQYSNPFDEACTYVSVCSPAFDPALVHREATSI
jgi:mannose-6-phosphate isomerase-like protein (cupin superfamily)